MFYLAKETWASCEWKDNTTNLLVGFCKNKELEDIQKQKHLFSDNTIFEVVEKLDDKKVNKVDAYYGYVFGMVYIFARHQQDAYKISFYIVEQTLIIVCEDDRCLEELKQEILQLDPCVCTLEKAVRAVLEYVLLSVVKRLDQVENEIAVFDEEMMNPSIHGILNKFREYRRLMLCMSHYMEQFLDVCENLLEDENTFFHIEHLHQLKIVKDKAIRVEERVRMMEEYVEQLKEEYQFQQDYRLNQTMYVFTVVTVIFLPLTLIVGWYGMNFTSMPEVTWKYGYQFVILLSVSVVGCLLYYLKKKKML